MCRMMSDGEVINLDTDDDDDVADAGDTSAMPCTGTSVAWDLSRAALQVEQMIEARYRTSPLGNVALLTTDVNSTSSNTDVSKLSHRRTSCNVSDSTKEHKLSSS